MTDIPSNLDDLDGPGDLLPAPSNPMAVARELVADHEEDGHLTLRRWRGAWMQWQRTHWAEAADSATESWLYQRLEHAWYTDETRKVPVPKLWEPNRRKVADVAAAIAAVTHLGDNVDPPAWLSTDEPAPAGEIVACTNGLLHVGTRKLYDHTPEFFGIVAVPFPYDQRAPRPARWIKFLAELWPDDQDSIAALQEYFGYVLSGRTDLHKILLLIGPTRSGKGTIARVLTALIGKANTAGPTLASLGTNFGLSPLLGKPLAVISDARLGDGGQHQVVERLLSVSGEDTLTVDRKYREPWTGKLPSRFLLLSNELPRFGDASGAIANRFIILQMTRSFLGHENTYLTKELLAELPGILSWALDGLDRLSREGALTEPASSSDARAALADLVSPVSAFVRDRCQHGGEITVDDLFAAWRSWCDDNGHRAGSKQTFGRNLRAVIPAVRIARPRDGESRERRYIGVSLSTTHNGWDRGPSRTSADSGPLDRDGPRSNPLWAQQADNPPRACPRHADTGFGPHKYCVDCQKLAGDGGRKCAFCGELIPPGKDPAAVYCSRGHKNAATKRRARAAGRVNDR
jgi:putative DNA primase/helicase